MSPLSAASRRAHHDNETSLALCMDPQTSGGLLAAVDPSVVPALVDGGFTVIGGFEGGPAGVTLA